MSSQPPFESASSKQPKGEIQHTHFLSEHIGALYLNDEYSDVTLVVDKQPFSAHKVILAARSEYFRAMLYGGLMETNLTEIVLKDTPLAAFKQLLRYIYTGQLSLINQSDELVLEILGLAHQYGFQDLQAAISDYLSAMLSIKNVCLIYDTASLYGLTDLVSSCWAFMDKFAVEVLAQESFVNLSSSGVKEIISRDSFCAPEVAIFRAVERWVAANTVSGGSGSEAAGEAVVKDILSGVRLSLMSTQDLLKVVRPTGLVQADILLDAIESRTESRDTELKYRGYLLVDQNVATPKLGASVLVGEVKQALLDGDTKNYDMERGFSRHPIDDQISGKEKGLVVKLGAQYILNHFRMLLWDKDQRGYSYYIEVSMDQEDWVRVIDHTKYLCRSWQELHFTPRVVRFIRIVGTHNTVNKVFHAVAFEAFYTKKPMPMDSHGIIIPRHNVATIPMCATVIEGVCRSRNALINGDTSNYDWDSGYTCHQLGSGAIAVQLAQPYALSSMRLLLWDCDKRHYSYYIETSVNKEDWEVVFDRSKMACRSWQYITFPRRHVVFIRIVGTHNTANEVFHCVHLESPAVTNLPDGDGTPVFGEAAATVDRRPSAGGSGSSDSSSTTEDSSVEGNADSVDMERRKGSNTNHGVKSSRPMNQADASQAMARHQEEESPDGAAGGSGLAATSGAGGGRDDVESIYSRSSPSLSQYSGATTMMAAAAVSTSAASLQYQFPAMTSFPTSTSRSSGNTSRMDSAQAGIPVGASACSMASQGRRSSASSLASSSFEQFVLRLHGHHRSSHQQQQPSAAALTSHAAEALPSAVADASADASGETSAGAGAAGSASTSGPSFGAIPRSSSTSGTNAKRKNRQGYSASFEH